MSAHEQIEELRRRMGTSIIGQEAVIERLVIGLLANGNLLVEGFPGLAKTRAIKSLAKNLEAEFSRIQFTPDLLPSDATGTEVLYRTVQGNEFRFELGPIFANIVLGDEINRLPPDSSYPTSRTVDGETWAGIVRHYEVSPLLAAGFELKEQVIKVSWANPGKSPYSAEVPVPDINYRGIVPEGAEGLSPFVAGSSLNLERQLSRTDDLKPGDAIVIETSAQLDGLPGFFLPELLPPDELVGVRSYPTEPVVSKDSRTEKITVIIYAPGQVTIPGRTIEWWYTATREVDSTTIEPITLLVTGAGLTESSPPSEWNWLWLLGLLLTVPLFMATRWMGRTIEPDEETLAYREAVISLKAGDAEQAYRHLMDWSHHVNGQGVFETFPPDTHGELRSLSKHLYRNSEEPVDFDALLSALYNARTKVRQLESDSRLVLPALNP